jgi:hypothetical protein
VAAPFDRMIVTGKLGSHQGVELELMLAGKKPAALITSDEGFKDFLPHVVSGKFAMLPAYIFCGSYCYLFAISDQKWRIERIKKIYDNAVKKDTMTDEDHVAIGMLLGYTEEDIKTFLSYK